MQHPAQQEQLKRTRLALVIALLGVILTLGFTLRFHDLGSRSLWSDELFTLAIAMHHPIIPEHGQPWFKRINVKEISDGDTFLTAKAGEQSPPLHDLVEKASINLLGATEFAARLPGAIASCVLLLWFAWFAVADPDARVRRTLLWAVFLLALSPALVTYSQDARAYSLGTSLLGMAGLLWMLRWRAGWRHWSPPGWGEIALFTLASYTHYNAALLVALLLGVDAIMATWNRSVIAWQRLLVVGVTFSVWLYFNSHTIFFTAGGGVAWGQYGPSNFVSQAIIDASVAVHQPWLAFILCLGWALLALHFFRRPGSALSAETLTLFFLASLVAIYVVLAAAMAARAGMASPRYFLFIVPTAMIAFSLCLVKLEPAWQVAAAAVVIVALALPGMRSPALDIREDYREMTEFAVKDTGEDVVFLFPWAPNRDLYRYYLDRLRGLDSRSQMRAVSSVEEAAQVCEQLKNVRHVAVVAHESGRERIDSVYAACGVNWPSRETKLFWTTFSEHWRAEPAVPSQGQTR
jgi:hypothetical protein